MFLSPSDMFVLFYTFLFSKEFTLWLRCVTYVRGANARRSICHILCFFLLALVLYFITRISLVCGENIVLAVGCDSVVITGVISSEAESWRG